MGNENTVYYQNELAQITNKQRVIKHNRERERERPTKPPPFTCMHVCVHVGEKDGGVLKIKSSFTTSHYSAS